MKIVSAQKGDPMVQSNLPQTIQSELQSSGSLQKALELILAAFEAATGTIHRADNDARFLHIAAHQGIPEKVLEVTATIPFGKGMAGICWERAEPVTVCNLQTDDSGVAKPGAKLTQVEGAVVIPIFAEDRAAVIGTLGIGKTTAHDYTEEEIAILEECAAVLAAKIQG